MIGLVQRWIREKKHVLVYGEAATGKTHLAYEFFLKARSMGLDPLILATEPGTVTFLTHRGAPFEAALTLDELAHKATSAILQGRYVIIDSINWHYRESPGLESARILGYIAALLYWSGGMSTAQVSGDATWPSGAPYILPYAHIVASTSRGKKGFLLAVLKPLRRTSLFRPSARGGVEWV